MSKPFGVRNYNKEQKKKLLLHNIYGLSVSFIGICSIQCPILPFTSQR